MRYVESGMKGGVLEGKGFLGKWSKKRKEGV